MKTNSLPFIDSKFFWYLFLSESKSFFSNFICFIINHDVYVITFLMYYTLSNIIYLRNKVKVAIVNSIFHVSEFLKLFIMSFKYDIIILRYLQVIVFYYYHCCFHIQYNFYSKNYLLLLVHNNVLRHTQKYFQYLRVFYL